MEEETKGATPPEEGAEPTPVKGEAAPTEKEVKGPTSPKTYSQKELDSAVGKALATVNQQLATQKAESEKLRTELASIETSKESMVDELQEIRAEHERLLGESDPDALKGYKDTQKLRIEARKVQDHIKALERREAELVSREYDLEQKGMKVQLANKAMELSNETGIPLERLKDCESEDKMEIALLRWQVEQQTSPKKEEKPSEATPRLDSGITTGGGEFPEHPTAEELESWPMSKYKEWVQWRESRRT